MLVCRSVVWMRFSTNHTQYLKHLASFRELQSKAKQHAVMMTSRFRTLENGVGYELYFLFPIHVPRCPANNTITNRLSVSTENNTHYLFLSQAYSGIPMQLTNLPHRVEFGQHAVHIWMRSWAESASPLWPARELLEERGDGTHDEQDGNVPSDCDWKDYGPLIRSGQQRSLYWNQTLGNL